MVLAFCSTACIISWASLKTADSFRNGRRWWSWGHCLSWSPSWTIQGHAAAAPSGLLCWPATCCASWQLSLSARVPSWRVACCRAYWPSCMPLMHQVSLLHGQRRCTLTVWSDVLMTDGPLLRLLAQLAVHVLQGCKCRTGGRSVMLQKPGPTRCLQGDLLAQMCIVVVVLTVMHCWCLQGGLWLCCCLTGAVIMPGRQTRLCCGAWPLQGRNTTHNHCSNKVPCV